MQATSCKTSTKRTQTSSRKLESRNRSSEAWTRKG